MGRAPRCHSASTQARKNIPLGRVSVDVAHDKVHAADCAECAADASPHAKIDRFTRTIAVDAEVTEELRTKIIEIANKCPVHRTLESSSVVSTSVDTLKAPDARATTPL